MAAPPKTNDKAKSLEFALAQIDKQFGKNSVMRLGDEVREPMKFIPTGSTALDVALGIGGLPRGRVVEIYGPESSGKTTVALHAVANAQRAGGIAAFIDAEHALDPEYAKKLGVDTDALLVSQPDTGEQALEIADMLIRSGALDIIVIDSVAALVPRAEIEGEMGDSHVGLQARLMSQALRKMTGGLSQTGTTAIFINQLREKIGVMFGCFSYSTRVNLADGSTEKIGRIVNQKLPVEVMSYDAQSNQVVPRKVTNWFDNGRADRFLQFTVEKSGGNGRSQFAATENHLIRTPGGWREAGEIISGDRVMVAEDVLLSQQQWQVVLGGVMGDGHLAPNTRGRRGTRFRMGHGAQQAEYLDWKASQLGNVGQCRSVRPNGAVHIDLGPLPELSELRDVVYWGDGKKHFTDEFIKSLTPLALAIWYMDDGSFALRSQGLQQRTQGGSGRSEICVEAMSAPSRDRLVALLSDEHGVDCRVGPRGALGTAVLTMTTAGTNRFHEVVAPYVHPSMEYKLLERHRGKFSVEPEFVLPTTRLVPAKVLDVHVKPPTRSMHRFDIEVEGSHSYFVDGVMVHNSPETTTGGKALKFYASVRLDVRRIETLKDGNEPVGNRTRVKVVKNKCLAAGTRVFDPVAGRFHRIEDVVDQRLPIHVMAADKAGHLHAAPVTAWFDQGVQEVVEVVVKGGRRLTVTSDHRVLTEAGWCEAGSLVPGDRVALPRQFGGFGDARPVTPDEARMLGYLVGDGYVGGKTPITLICAAAAIQRDAARIAAALGCVAHERHGYQVAFSHRPGATNELLALTRRAGIHGKLAWEKAAPAQLLGNDVDKELVAQFLYGLLETDGHVSTETTGATRVGFTTTSEQLAHQVSWLLLRMGIASSIRRYDPTQKRPSIVAGREVRGSRDCFEVRIAGMDNVTAFSAAIPGWGPRSAALAEAVVSYGGRMRGSQQGYFPQSTKPEVLAHLSRRRLTVREAAAIVGASQSDVRGGMSQVLGASRLRRDRVALLAAALDDPYLQGLVDEQIVFASVRSVTPAGQARTYDVEVEELHNLVAEGVVVHNCSPPFKQAEFDILYGLGISREGGLIDMGVEHGFIRKSGAWYTYEGDQLGQGKENARTFLRDNPDLGDEIERKIKEKLGIGQAKAADVVELPTEAKVDF